MPLARQRFFTAAIRSYSDSGMVKPSRISRSFFGLAFFSGLTAAGRFTALAVGLRAAAALAGAFAFAAGPADALRRTRGAALAAGAADAADREVAATLALMTILSLF
jgi:hypothetical protein